MTDLDMQLARIGALPTDPRLATIDGAVLAGLAEAAAQPPVLPGAALGVIAALALMAGAAVAAIPRPATPSTGLDPFGTPMALAPSTLLGGEG